MKILLTGGAGFIGSHLADCLLEDDNQIIALDNLSTGSAQNISHLYNNQAFTFFEGNILNYKLMQKLISECDCIYHLAAAVGVKYIVDNPLESLITNVRGTEIILELAHTFKKKVFIASSSEVYGKDGSAPFKETDDRVLGSSFICRWGYAFSKGIDEFLALAYYKSKQLPVVVGRLFNICGPRQSANYGMVIPRFIEQAFKNESITIYGDGKQVRSFTYVLDAVRAIKTLMDEPKAEGEIFNIGSKEAITIADLAHKIKTLTKSDSQITFVPYKKAYDKGFEDMFYRVPDVTKIEALLGSRPQKNIDQILETIINSHRGD